MSKNGDKRKKFYENIKQFSIEQDLAHNTITTKELIDLCVDAGYTAKQSHNDQINILLMYEGLRRIRKGVYAINLKRIVQLYKEQCDGEWEHNSTPERIIEKMKEFVGKKFINKIELRKFFLTELAISNSLHYMRNVIAPYLKSGYITVDEKGVYTITKMCLIYNQKEELPSSSPFVLNKIREKIKSAFDNHKMPLWVVAVRIWKEGIITTMQFIRRTVKRILFAVPS